ncbi:hypothetical protein Salat_2437300 [Sesamum alatum]|uniref:Uncharacterized protein n=1 Tax=Sesamum alatum TaxID=300844 RepID=A0AAE2CFI5_9LAMI|nr:hypothetical protein Salat_2437300 [Sesamum alatum]
MARLGRSKRTRLSSLPSMNGGRMHRFWWASELGPRPSSTPQMSSNNAFEISGTSKTYSLACVVSERGKCTILTIPNSRWYRWNGEAEYERLAIIFEPPMGGNVDQGPTSNPVVEPVDEENNAAKNEGEEEKDTEGGGLDERNERSQEEEDDDDGDCSDLEIMHSDFKSGEDEDALLMPSSSTSAGSSMFSEHSSNVCLYVPPIFWRIMKGTIDGCFI